MPRAIRTNACAVAAPVSERNIKEELVVSYFNIILLERELMSNKPIHARRMSCHSIPKEFVGKLYPMLNERFDKFTIVTSGNHCDVEISY